MRKIAAMLVDDHEVVLEGIERVLSLDGRIEVIAKARTIAEALVYLDELEPDVIVLDLRLPDGDGFAAIDKFRELVPRARIVAMTGYGKTAKPSALRAGADAFLTKELASDIITQTICNLFPLGSLPEPSTGALTARELEVARLVASGLSNDEIARALSLSKNTVKTHLGSVLRKLEFKDRIDLIMRWKQDRGL